MSKHKREYDNDSGPGFPRGYSSGRTQRPKDPMTHTIEFILPDGRRARVEASEEEFLLQAAYRAGLDLPSMCLQGWCITCAAQVAGGGEWDQSASRRYFPQDREAGFILLCTARARSDLTIHTHRREA